MYYVDSGLPLIAGCLYIGVWRDHPEKYMFGIIFKYSFLSR